MKNKKIFISLILAVLLFVALIFVEKNLLNVKATKQIAYVKTDIKRGDKLNKDMFVMKDKDITEINTNMMFSISDIENYYAAENMYADEIVNTNRITEQQILKYELMKGERSISISFDKLSNAVAGTLRKGDLIDIILTKRINNSNDLKITETLEQQIRVIGAKNPNGEFIEENIKNATANYLILAVTPTQEHEIFHAIENGTIRLSRVPEGTEKHEKIIVQDEITNK